MEFDKNSNDRSPDISDDERTMATTKRVVLTPLHSDVTPEALPDSEEVSAHDAAAPPPTIAHESEDTSTYQRTAAASVRIAEQPSLPVMRILVSCLILILLGTLVYLFLAK